MLYFLQRRLLKIPVSAFFAQPVHIFPPADVDVGTVLEACNLLEGVTAPE